MSRDEYFLAVMSAIDAGSFTPVQLQKTFFIIDREIANQVGGPYFKFQPYHYGPFDKEVYEVAATHERSGNISIVQDSTRGLKIYSLTSQGRESGEAMHSSLKPEVMEYIKRVLQFIQTSSFSGLVGAIYKAYPDMKVNSVFNEKQ